MSKFINLFGFQSELQSPLEKGATSMILPAADAKEICEKLGDVCGGCFVDDSDESTEEVQLHSYLVVSAFDTLEIVKVLGCDGGAVVIERAQDCTNDAKFPKGACVKFAWNPSAFVEMVQAVNNDDVPEC